MALFRMVQELVNNTLKHAQAQRSQLSMLLEEEVLIVEYGDNGQGFDTAVLAASNGNGWKNIGQRANLINAEVAVDSQPNRAGTTFILNVPLQSSADQNND